MMENVGQLLVRGVLAFLIGFLFGAELGLLGMFAVGLIIGIFPWPLRF